MKHWTIYRQMEATPVKFVYFDGDKYGRYNGVTAISARLDRAVWDRALS